MKKLIVMGLVAGLLMPATVWAQGPGGGMGGGGGRRNSPKGRLSGVLRGIGELEKGKAPLTKAQAKQVVGVVMPWTKKPKMTEAEAKAVYMKLNAVLTTKQKNELDKQTALRRRTAGDREGGPGGGAGGGAPDPQRMQQMRQQMQKMQGFFKTYNPFYPVTAYKEIKNLPERFSERMVKGYRDRQALLAKLAQKAK